MDEEENLTGTINPTSQNSNYIMGIVLLIFVCIIIYFVYTKSSNDKITSKIRTILERQQKNLNISQISMPE